MLLIMTDHMSDVQITDRPEFQCSCVLIVTERKGVQKIE